ncbi:unnamed protein product [Prorocentrum cordatum]|uniref:EF-hand domain-containing protein n=1 Tax=Prorocentrum cordatum TaxID=2364126 RepID=A0ABN9RLN0_9DINO|nr:unnamed protein product [Polarella glacialis]CAK0863142.1 unnamed protein product [Polarella glacialis]
MPPIRVRSSRSAEHIDGGPEPPQSEAEAQHPRASPAVHEDGPAGRTCRAQGPGSNREEDFRSDSKHLYEEMFGLLLSIESTQADHQRAVLEKLDQLERHMGGGPAAQAPRMPGQSGLQVPEDVRFASVRRNAVRMTASSQYYEEGSQARQTEARPSIYEERRRAPRIAQIGLNTNITLQKLSFQAVTEHAQAASVGMQRGYLGLPRQFCLDLVSHPLFDMVMSTVIVLNSVCIGAELTMQPSPDSGTPETRFFFVILKTIFLIIYVVELACRFCGSGTRCLRRAWVKFDFVLVVVCVIDSWFLPVVALIIGKSVTQLLPGILFFRIFRLARVARALRLFAQFRSLWMLVSGLSSSFIVLVNIFLVLLVTIFVFSCVGVEVITNHSKGSAEGNFKDLVDQYWSSLPTIMLTLVQLTTLDAASAIYTPMIHEDSWLVLFFMPFLLLVSVILMNLITAVTIDAVRENLKNDHETQRLWSEHRMQELRPKLRNIFSALDADGNGQLSLRELQRAPREVQNELANILNVDSLSDLFHAVDADGNNEVTIEEFFEGMAWLLSDNPSLEIIRNLALLRLIKRDLEELKAHMKSAMPLPPIPPPRHSSSSR